MMMMMIIVKCDPPPKNLPGFHILSSEINTGVKNSELLRE